MRKNWMAVLTVVCCLTLFAAAAFAQECTICGGDAVCDTCNGLGYQTLTAYGSNESLRVKCTANCSDGYCPDCKTVSGGRSAERSGVVATEYDVLGFSAMKIAIGIDEAGRIVSFEVLEHNETPGFGASVIDAGFDSLIGQNIAAAKFDAVSGVTLTSNGINDALRQAAAAYASAPVKKEMPSVPASVYEATGFTAMKVAIAVDDSGRIVSVEVVEHNETPGFGASVIDAGFDSLIGQSIAAARFDTVSGATLTSNGINDALRQAAVNWQPSQKVADISAFAAMQGMTILLQTMNLMMHMMLW